MIFSRARSLWRFFSLTRRLHYLPTMSAGKINSPGFSALLTSDLLQLENTFKSAGYDFRLVGGVVRDLLLGRTAKDIDIGTDCKPDDTAKLLTRAGFRPILTGLKHGTIIALKGGVSYEITTLRVDRITDGRHAEVEFVNDWKLDALRRDLTINSMSLSLDGTLHDYFQGEKHLAERKVLFVGDPHSRITEDYLRILRYFRFYGRIVPTEGKHDQHTLEAIRELAEGLQQISVERIWMEMAKILVGNHAPHLIQLMYELGVARNIKLPDNADLGELNRVWGAMKSRAGGSKPDEWETLDPASLLATLVQTSSEFVTLATAWNLSKKERNLGAFIIEHKETAYSPDTTVRYFQDMLVDKIEFHSVLELIRYCDRCYLASVLRGWEVPVMPVSGHDLIEAGFKGGRRIGFIKEALMQVWKDSGYSLEKEVLVEQAREIDRELGSSSEEESIWYGEGKRRKLK